MQEKAKILVYCVYVRSKYIYIGQKDLGGTPVYNFAKAIYCHFLQRI